MSIAPGFAADLFSGGGSLKDPAAASALAVTGYVDVTNDYIFRGVSNNHREVSGQGGADLTYGIFYAGTFFTGVQFGAPSAIAPADVELDLYGGIKPKWGDITFDFGVITYNYINSKVNHHAGLFDPFYYEFKAGASATVLKDVSLSGTVYVSPDYFGETGEATTLEGTASKPITKIHDVDIAASGTIGHTFYGNAVANGAKNFDYTYGNLGLTGTYKTISLDLRWWDTDLPAAGCVDPFKCGSAFAATFKVAF
jgi:uncharacterized protein (TIGR02001 family)